MLEHGEQKHEVKPPVRNAQILFFHIGEKERVRSMRAIVLNDGLFAVHADVLDAGRKLIVPCKDPAADVQNPPPTAQVRSDRSEPPPVKKRGQKPVQVT